MRTSLIITIAFGILHGLSRADSEFIPRPLDYSDPLPIEGKCPQPDFPAKALADSVEGRVIFWVHVDTTGFVDRWHIAQEKPEGYGFGLEAERAIVNWEFSPACQSGRTVAVWIAVPFNFKLHK